MKTLILLTGASRRIGREMVLHLQKKMNCSFYLTSKSKSTDSTSLIEILKKTKTNYKWFYLDMLETPGGNHPLFQESISEFDRIVCINNASLFYPSNGEDENKKKFMNIHYHWPKSIIEHCINNVSAGQVINFTDANNGKELHEYRDYLESKEALENLTYKFAKHKAPQWRLNNIAPGPILPPNEQVKRNDDEGKKVFDRHVQSTPLRKSPGIEGILHALDFILDSEWMTGQSLYVDSGLHLN